MKKDNDFSQGPVWRRIMAQAIPLTVAEIVHLLYNVVDRVYIGHLSSTDSMALTGVGLIFPIVSLIAAFTSLFGTGGAPLFAIARGAQEEEKASRIQSNVFVLLVGCSLVLMALCYAFQKPVLYLFGASDASYPYAEAYLTLYLLGTPFTMLATGMNGFINAQGFPRIGMLTTMLGAILNLVLDPLFIFVFKMGVRGAAIATVISQVVSALWVLRFLTGKQALIPLRRDHMKIQLPLLKKILSLGIVGFIMKGTNSLVQIVCNATLQTYGGDLYVGIMTVVNSVREILYLPVSGITSGAQPVIGFNYGAKAYSRVRQGIKFMTIACTAYTAASWIAVLAATRFFVSIFSSDAAMLAAGMKHDQIRALVALSPACMIPQAAREGTLLGQSFDPDHIPDTLPSWNNDILDGNYVRVAQTIHVEDEIARYTGNVLIVQGDEDEAVPYEYAVKAQKLYAHCRLVTIPGDDHCYDRHLDQVTKAIREFMTEEMVR